MPDNVAVTPGAGATVLADEVTIAGLGTGVVQLVKLVDGAVNGTAGASVGASGGLAVRGAPVAGTSGSIAAAGTGTVGPLAVGEAGNVTFAVRNTTAASAFAGAPVLVFEQSDDNVSWGPLQAVRASDGAVGSTFAVAPVGANGSMMFDAAAEGINWVRARVTTGPTTNPMTVAILAGGMPFSPVVATVPRRDAGRSARNIVVDGFAVAATTADVIMTLSTSADGAAATTGTSYNVTAGKRLRVQSIALGLNTVAGNTTAAVIVAKVRVNAAGAATNASPVQFVAVLPGVATANGGSSLNVPIPDGWELPGGAGLAITITCAGYAATTAAPRFSAAITAFEY